MTKSQKDALALARTALYGKQYELLREIRQLLKSADESAKDGVEVHSWITDSLTDRKAKLAEVMVARETLYGLD